MSDHPSVQAAMAGIRLRQRCNGAPGCPCMSSSAEEESSASSSPPSPTPSPSASPSPSGSRTRSSHGTPSGSDSGDSNQSLSDSQNSDAVPEGFPVQEWSGLQRVEIGKCSHGRSVILKKCSEGKHTGRRFLGCAMLDDEEQCQYKEWLEAPWPARVQTCLKALWRELKMSRRCNATANSTLCEALQVREVAVKANANLVKKVERTKNKAHKICSYYHGIAGKAVKQRNQLQNLTYSLFAVIAILVAVIAYLVK